MIRPLYRSHCEIKDSYSYWIEQCLDWYCCCCMKNIYIFYFVLLLNKEIICQQFNLWIPEQLAFFFSFSNRWFLHFSDPDNLFISHLLNMLRRMCIGKIVYFKMFPLHIFKTRQGRIHGKDRGRSGRIGYFFILEIK